MWDSESAACLQVVDESEEKKRTVSTFRIRQSDSAVMIVKSTDGQGQLVEVLKPSGDEVSYRLGT